jgi:hypothetical protein
MTARAAAECPECTAAQDGHLPTSPEGEANTKCRKCDTPLKGAWWATVNCDGTVSNLCIACGYGPSAPGPSSNKTLEVEPPAYKLAAVARPKRDANQDAADLAEYADMGMADAKSVVRALELKSVVSKACNAIARHAKAYVDEHGPIVGDRKEWGPNEVYREQRVNMKLEDFEVLLAGCGVTGEPRKNLLRALKKAGAGEFAKITRYEWGRK